MPEHAGGLGYLGEEIVLYKEICPRCGSGWVKKITLNGRKKDRKCDKCQVSWNHSDPEGSWSMVSF